MGTFKGKENDLILDLCQKHFCKVFIIPRNLINRSQSLDITANIPAKSFISNKYNELFSMQVSQQSEKRIQPVCVQVSLGFTELKVMYVKWILELYNY